MVKAMRPHHFGLAWFLALAILGLLIAHECRDKE
jgi:hypothetical protein